MQPVFPVGGREHSEAPSLGLQQRHPADVPVVHHLLEIVPDDCSRRDRIVSSQRAALDTLLAIAPTHIFEGAADHDAVEIAPEIRAFMRHGFTEYRANHPLSETQERALATIPVARLYAVLADIPLKSALPSRACPAEFGSLRGAVKHQDQAVAQYLTNFVQKERAAGRVVKPAIALGYLHLVRQRVDTSALIVLEHDCASPWLSPSAKILRELLVLEADGVAQARLAEAAVRYSQARRTEHAL